MCRVACRTARRYAASTRSSVPHHVDGQMPTPDSVPVDGPQHSLVASIARGTDEEPILLQHLH
jgi:hypothetical protein